MTEHASSNEDRRDIWNAPVVPTSKVLLRNLVTIAEVELIVALSVAVVQRILDGTWVPEPDQRRSRVITTREAVRTMARAKALSRLYRNVDINEAPVVYTDADRAAARTELAILGRLSI